MTYPHVASVLRAVENDGKFIYASHGSIKCFRQPASQEYAELFALTLSKASVVYMAVNADVNEKDRLVINGVTYGVKGIRVHDYGRLAHKRAGVEQL